MPTVTWHAITRIALAARSEMNSSYAAMVQIDILTRALSTSQHTVESRVGDETVLLHLENAAYYGLDATGTRIWELLKAGAQPPAICRTIADEYAVPLAQVEEDARRFLADLLAHSIVIAE